MLVRIIVSNVVLLISMSSESSSASADAVRGKPSSTAISPKKSPFSMMASSCFTPAMVRKMRTAPDWTTYISLPRSPST